MLFVGYISTLEIVLVATLTEFIVFPLNLETLALTLYPEVPDSLKISESLT